MNTLSDCDLPRVVAVADVYASSLHKHQENNVSNTKQLWERYRFTDECQDDIYEYLEYWCNQDGNATSGNLAVDILAALMIASDSKDQDLRYIQMVRIAALAIEEMLMLRDSDEE